MENIKSNGTSKREMHLSHGALLCLSIAFSWVLWCIVDLPVFIKMNGWPLIWEILKNFGEQIIETTILLELSLVYIRFIVEIPMQSDPFTTGVNLERILQPLR